MIDFDGLRVMIVLASIGLARQLISNPENFFRVNRINISYSSYGSLEYSSAKVIFDTGDIANIDSHGIMQITDRAKDVIKSGGEWISFVDIENSAHY